MRGMLEKRSSRERLMRVLILGEYGDRPEAALVEGLARRGFSITAVYRPGNLMYRSLERAGLDPIPLVPRAKLDLRAVRRVRELITSRPFDIMHVFTSRMLFIGLLASRDCRRLKRVLHRGTVYEPRRWRPFDRVAFFNPAIHSFICIARAVTDALLRSGIPEQKVRTIYKAHDAGWYGEPATDIRSQWQIPPGRFIVGTVANVRPVKGIDTLARAVASLADMGLDVHAVVVGKDPGGRLGKLVSRLGLSGRFTCTGYREDVLRIVPGFDCFVMPSLSREGLCKAVMEAVLMDVPVIASRAGGLPEQITHDSTGLLFESGDSDALAGAVLRLAGDVGLRSRLAAAAREHVQREMTVDKMVHLTAKLYEDLANGD